MLRSSIYTASALLLGASAFAQSDLTSKIHPITAPVKNAGTLNLATGQWTRHANHANGSGPGTIYNNTCNTGYFGGFENFETVADEGRIPSLSSPDVPFVPGLNNGSSKPGCADNYTVDGFQIGYCTDQLSIDMDVQFLDAYDTCTDINDPTFNPGPINAAFGLNGVLPASSIALTQACWLVTFDLNSPPQTVDLRFPMAADAGISGPGYVDGVSDLFGWSFHITSGTGTPPSQTGFIIAGDELTCAGYDGTIFDNSTSLDGTGMTTQDQFRIEDANTPANNGCYWFGGAPGNPMGSFHLELYDTAVVCSGAPPGTAFCSAGNDIATMCPCFTSQGQIATPGHGCGNSVFTGGAQLAGTGTAQIGNDSVTLTGSDVPAGVLTILLASGTAPIAPVVFHDGIRCNASLDRIANQQDGVGNPTDSAVIYGEGSTADISTLSTNFPAPTSGQTYSYYVWYRNPNTAWCTVTAPNTFANITNGYAITWQ